MEEEVLSVLNSSVILIGMPGSGKSTVGKMLARELAVDFCDTDDLITQSTGEKLQETLDKRGREGFLDKERRTLMEFSPKSPMVISTGGSVVLHEDVMKRLREMGTIVFLDADLPLIRKRLWNLDSRGIVFNGNDDDIMTVYKEREPLYYKYSDVRIHIRHRHVGDIVKEIMRDLGKLHVI